MKIRAQERGVAATRRADRTGPWALFSRVLLASGLLGLALLVGAASSVQAQEDHPTATKAGEATTQSGAEAGGEVPENVKAAGFAQVEAYHCIEKQLKEAKPNFTPRCIQAPSPIVPATNELIYGGASFAVVLLFFIWKGYPAVKKGMDARTDRIRDDLQRADDAKGEAEQVLVEYQAQVANARQEATRIIEDARATADGLKADLKKRAEAEIAEERVRAQAEIEAFKTQALADLRGEVASLAIGAAEVVVEKNLDAATQTQLIENYINSVGARN